MSVIFFYLLDIIVKIPFGAFSFAYGIHCCSLIELDKIPRRFL